MADDDLPTDAELEASRIALSDKLTELEELFARDAERERKRSIPQMKPDPPPATAAEKLAIAEQKFAALVMDDTSSMADVRRAAVLRDRARIAAAEEEKREALFGQMARSLDLQARDRAERDAAERRLQRERDAAEEKAKELRDGFAKRQKYLAG